MVDAYPKADLDVRPQHNGLAVGVVLQAGDGEDADDLDGRDEEAQREQAAQDGLRRLEEDRGCLVCCPYLLFNFKL